MQIYSMHLSYIEPMSKCAINGETKYHEWVSHPDYQKKFDQFYTGTVQQCPLLEAVPSESKTAETIVATTCYKYSKTANSIISVSVTCGIISLTGSLDFFKGDPKANGPIPPLRKDDFGDKGAPDALLGDRGGVLPDENNEGMIDPDNVAFPIPGTDKETPALASSSSDKTCMYRSLLT